MRNYRFHTFDKWLFAIYLLSTTVSSLAQSFEKAKLTITATVNITKGTAAVTIHNANSMKGIGTLRVLNIDVENGYIDYNFVVNANADALIQCDVNPNVSTSYNIISASAYVAPPVVNYQPPPNATVIYVTKGTNSKNDHGGGAYVKIPRPEVEHYVATGQFNLPDTYKPANVNGGSKSSVDIKHLVTPALASWNNDSKPVYNHADLGMVVDEARWIPAENKIIVSYRFTKLPPNFPAKVGELYILAGVWIVLEPEGPHPEFPRP